MEKAGRMTSPHFNPDEQRILLKIARDAIDAAVHGQPLPTISLDSLPPNLSEKGGTFVTLTIQGRLRGCIGTLEAYLPVAMDVQEHAVAAAMQDSRFPILQPSELPLINIEISVLTPKQPLTYTDSADLLEKLRPGIDGVVLQDGFRKATFLPQVWEKIPDPGSFLTQLCMKMGAPGNLWQKKPLTISTYQVEEFHE
jgi:AmmeMemoRadiSam system protein A